METKQKELHKHPTGDMIPDENTGSVKLTYSRSANEFAYELSAFFAALRSSIDFIAKLCALHLKGAQADSISNFLKWIDQGKTGSILKVVAKHQKWLRSIRDYRDYVVHRLVILTQIGGQKEWKYGEWHNVRYPVVVPSTTPKHVPDTRQSRAMASPEDFFDVMTSHSTATGPDGTLLKRDYDVKIFPSSGYIEIDDLMDRELKAFEDFFIAVLTTLKRLKFKAAALDGPKK
jgi:hypothetical protein